MFLRRFRNEFWAFQILGNFQEIQIVGFFVDSFKSTLGIDMIFGSGVVIGREI